MPVPFLKNLSKETGKSISELEKLWGKAKKLASEHFDKPESEFADKEFAYVVGVVKKMAKKKEDVLSYNAYWYDKICTEFDDIVTASLKKAFYKIPKITVDASGTDSSKIYTATIEHITPDDYKMFPKTYLKSELKKKFPDKKISMSSYSHPRLTSGDYEVTITLKNNIKNENVENFVVTEDVKIVIKKGESIVFEDASDENSVCFDEMAIYLAKDTKTMPESADFMANRALLQKFAIGVDYVFDKDGRRCGLKIDHRFSRAIAGNSEYIVDCIATSEDLFNAFEKEYLNPYCRGFRDVTYTYEDRRLRTGLHRTYTFSEGKLTEDIDSQNSIVINEECRIPGTDIVLEPGDEIKINENVNVAEINDEKEFEADVMAVYNDLNKKYPGAFNTYNMLSALLDMFPGKYRKYSGKQLELNMMRDMIRQIAHKKHLDFGKYGRA